MNTAFDFWRGRQGDDYIGRNDLASDQFQSRCLMWQKILANCAPRQPLSALEVGANIGRNLRAISTVSPGTELIAVEPNAAARSTLSLQPFMLRRGQVFSGAAQALPMTNNFADLVFTCGVLIHIPPSDLLSACREIVRVSRRWVVAIEYFSDKEEMIRYRGEDNKLWKRDFGKFYLDHFPLRPVHVGFEWRVTTGLDNLTWWVFEKTDAK